MESAIAKQGKYNSNDKNEFRPVQKIDIPRQFGPVQF